MGGETIGVFVVVYYMILGTNTQTTGELFVTFVFSFLELICRIFIFGLQWFMFYRGFGKRQMQKLSRISVGNPFREDSQHSKVSLQKNSRFFCFSKILFLIKR
jgi:hypothetical protein